MSYGTLSDVRTGPCSLGKPGAWYVAVVAPERSHDDVLHHSDARGGLSVHFLRGGLA